MAISTFTELKTAVANYANRVDLTTEIPDFITIAESKTFRKLRVREMEVVDESFSITAETVAVPTRFQAAIRFYLDRDPLVQLIYASPLQMFTQFPSATSGTPQVFTIEGSNFRFRPVSTSETGKLHFYQSPVVLSDANPSNAILSSYPDIYLYGALAELFWFLKDPNKATQWKTLWLDAINEANDEDENDKISGSALTAISARDTP